MGPRRGHYIQYMATPHLYIFMSSYSPLENHYIQHMATPHLYVFMSSYSPLENHLLREGIPRQMESIIE